MTDIQQARKWAENGAVKVNSGEVIDEIAKAAVRVIQSLPDRWIDAEEMLEALEGCDEMTYPYEVIEHIEKTLLTPYQPTLAELIESGNDPKQYQWMQCKEAHFPTGGTGAQGIILASGETSSLILERNGAAVTWNNRLVTPLSGEPKLEWPSLSVSDKSEAVSVETEDVTEESRTALPCPEDVPAEEPWVIRYKEREWVGVRKSGTGSFPWSLASMDGRTRDCAFDSVIALVSRLVPGPVVKTLRTVEDYEAAAIGTVVRRQEVPWLAATFHKCVDGIWSSTVAHEYPSSEMAGTARTVLWEPKP